MDLEIIKKFKNISEWREYAKDQGYSVPVQACHGLSLAMEIFGLSFYEAYKKLIEKEKLIPVDKTYFFDLSYIQELLEMKNTNPYLLK